MMNKGMRDKDMLDQKKSNFSLGKGSLVAQSIKNPSACFLGWEDPLEEGVATHSSILAWRIPWTEEPGGLQPVGSQRVGQD